MVANKEASTLQGKNIQILTVFSIVIYKIFTLKNSLPYSNLRWEGLNPTLVAHLLDTDI